MLQAAIQPCPSLLLQRYREVPHKLRQALRALRAHEPRLAAVLHLGDVSRGGARGSCVLHACATVQLKRSSLLIQSSLVLADAAVGACWRPPAPIQPHPKAHLRLQIVNGNPAGQAQCDQEFELVASIFDAELVRHRHAFLCVPCDALLGLLNRYAWLLNNPSRSLCRAARCRRCM